jgi:pimeloyl-ACP methyl ester carboxylesterase
VTSLAPKGILQIGHTGIEYRMIGPSPKEAATLVLLHEGLGSVGLWGDFPDKLSAATGAGVFVYSRKGHGLSNSTLELLPLNCMQVEALDILPRILDLIGFRRGMLIGHSDGASIATIYAGGVQDHRIRGLSLIAPHFIVEDCTIAAIKDAKRAYETGDLRAKLSRWHMNVDGAFNGWSNAWLNPAFRQWNISEALGYIRVPIQIIQGDYDPYGTSRQIEIAEEECYCPVDVTLLKGIGHLPHKEAQAETLKGIADYANHILKYHGEGQMG